MRPSPVSPRGVMATTTGLLLLASLTSASAMNFFDSRSLAEAEDSTPIYNARLQRCPQACSVTGFDDENWTTYTDLDELAVCEETILFTTNVQYLLSDPNSQTYIKACTTSDRGPKGMTAGEYQAAYLDSDGMALATPREDVVKAFEARKRSVERRAFAVAEREADDEANCGAVPKKANLEVEEAWHGQAAEMTQHHKNAALELARYLEESGECGQTIVFAAAGGLQSIVGVMAGGDVSKPSVGALLRTYSPEIATASSYMRQSCGEMSHGRGFGVAADMKGDISAVQAALGTWAKGECLDKGSYLGGSKKEKAELTVLGSGIDEADDATSGNATSRRRSPLQSLAKLLPRAECKTEEVKAGDSCGSLAKRCGITGANFEKYNSKQKNLCSSLKEKQLVCCSTGTLPDRRPQPDKNGNCFTYKVKKNDGCWDIADKHFLTTKEINEFNKNTWGWPTCEGQMNELMVICLSKGDPPMPTEDKTALCGPTVPGSKRPSDWDKIAELNPCPIKACCNVWGQCGVTTDFCLPHPIKGGGPGTSEPKKNGCVSSCGSGIKNNDSPPKEWRTVGYFEAWNKERKCLHMEVKDFDDEKYNHMHFAFATITTDFQVELKGEVKKSFDDMTRRSGWKAKKVLSFGGWAFSNEHGTSPIFRDSVSPANRALFATRVVQFLKDNDLDGLDFDWEYPGAYDIPGSTPGNKDDGKNYLEFLKAVKDKLPSGKTLSIALPASYWYLRHFPVDKMKDVVDYFVFMAYDLHGQWDHGSKWASPGCPTGNCLRSHVNRTETFDALGMVTRAGAQAAQVLVGVSSYGRSFKMADPSCSGPNCKFTGTNTTSNAEKGECTDTAGYIADAEIAEIIMDSHMGGDEATVRYDSLSSSDIMTWRGNWVAYMGKTEKLNRFDDWKDLNFGGITDWAVDLQSFDGEEAPDPDDEDYISSIEPCEESYEDLAAVASDADNIPSHCWAFYTLEALAVELDKALEEYQKVKDDYDGKFRWYSKYINDMVDPKLRDWLNDREDPKGAGKLTGKGNKFFKCKYREHGKDNWSYDGDCPIPDSARGPWATQDIKYEIRDKKKLEEGLAEDLGIPMDWLEFGFIDHGYSCDGQAEPCTSVPEWKLDFPIKKKKIDVPDPKDIMKAAEKNMTELRVQIDSAVFAAGLGMYQGNDVDAAIALGSPVAQIAQAVASMENVKEIGEEVEEEHKKELILSIVGLVLMVVPFVGEVGAALAGFTRLARFAFVAGELGNGALDMIDIIENPETAPYVIAGYLFGAVGDKMDSSKRFNNAATVRRNIKDGDLNGMGKTYKSMDSKVNKVCDRCA